MSVALVALVALVAAAWLRGLWIVLADRRDVPRLEGTPPPPMADAAPLVSIILPARDEAANIERCVTSLLAQRWPRFEVIAVDDGSTDGTGEILARLAAADARLTVVRGAPLPDGWLGKNHACAQGAARARGALLLFTDADAVHLPECLPLAVAAHARLGADLLTAIPHLECVGVAEKLCQPAILGGTLTIERLGAINAGRARIAFAIGHYLLFRRSAYEAIGGHAGARASVVDDLALARATVRAGLALRVVLAPDALRVRMYRRFAELWWGYAKNMAAAPALFLGLEGTRLRRAAAVATTFATSVWILALGFAPLVALAHGGVAAAFGGVALAAALAQRGLQNRDVFRISPAWALTFPLGNAVSAAINAHSGWRKVTGAGVAWKGRRTR